MSDNYLWLKALHVTFMVSWFAGLIYLPRLFTYHARADDAPGRERFQGMEMRLFVVMTIGAALTVILGYILVVTNTAIVGATWFRLKLLLVIGLAVYHYRCYRWIVKLRDETGPRDAKWLRWFSEIPAAFLLAIVLLAVAKPF
jgi:putative membrane protein